MDKVIIKILRYMWKNQDTSLALIRYTLSSQAG